MDGTLLGAIIGATVVVGGGLLREARARGRIEEGVKGLYSKLDDQTRALNRRMNALEEHLWQIVGGHGRGG